MKQASQPATLSPVIPVLGQPIYPTRIRYQTPSGVVTKEGEEINDPAPSDATNTILDFPFGGTFIREFTANGVTNYTTLVSASAPSPNLKRDNTGQFEKENLYLKP